MMTGKRVFGLLALVSLLALSATGAEAGAGGSPSPLASFFLCKSIGGASASGRVDVDSFDASGAGWSQALQNVKIGVATLACRFARLYPADGTTHTACSGGLTPPDCNEIDPQPLVGTPPAPLNGEDLKCYAVSTAKGPIPQIPGVPNPPASYTTIDALLGTDPNVSGSSVQYICAPARFSPNF